MKNKFTIAMISSHAPSLNYFRGPLISALRDCGFKVLALAPNYDDAVREAVRDWGGIPIDCAINRTGMNPFLDLANAYRLSKQLKELAPDLVLGYFIKPVIFGTLAAWSARIPTRLAMIEGLGFVFTPGPKSFSLPRRFLRWGVMVLYRFSLARTQKTLFLNPDDMQEFISRRLVSANKTLCVGGIGVDLDAWQPSPLVTLPITFLLIARLLREKGVIEYVSAARAVKKEYPTARFILLGGVDDNPGAVTTSEVEEWVNEGIIEWHGHVPVRAWISQASVYVLPSYREGVPVSTQEAMAMGRPVITTDVPGCRETVIDGVNGFLVPPQDTEMLADRMMRFIRNPELVDLMGKESRRLAIEKFDVKKINQRLIEILLREAGRDNEKIGAL